MRAIEAASMAHMALILGLLRATMHRCQVFEPADSDARQFGNDGLHNIRATTWLWLPREPDMPCSGGLQSCEL